MRDPRLSAAGPRETVPEKHTHKLDEISGLVGALAVRVRAEHKHTISSVTGLEARLTAIESAIAQLTPLLAIIQGAGVFGLGDYDVGSAPMATGTYAQPADTTIDGGTYAMPPGSTLDGGPYIWAAS